MVTGDGAFFCHACLVDKPEAEASPDNRYCHGCYEFLVKEAELLPPGKRPAWIPKSTRLAARTSSEAPQGAQDSQNNCNKILTGVRHRVGRPCADLPVEQVVNLASQGYSLRRVAAKLGVSHMAVKRVLARAKTGYTFGGAFVKTYGFGEG